MSTITLIHVLSATAALLIGAWQLFAAKRGARHRLLGYSWIFSMLVASLSSFGLRSDIGFAWLGGFGPIHALSVFTMFSLALALRYAIARDFRRHRLWIVGTYGGLVGAGVFATAIPGRAMHTLLFVELPRMAAEGWPVLTLALQ